MAYSNHRTNFYADAFHVQNVDSPLPAVPQLELTIHFFQVTIDPDNDQQLLIHELRVSQESALESFISPAYISANTATLLFLIPQLGGRELEHERAWLAEGISSFVRRTAEGVSSGTLQVSARIVRGMPTEDEDEDEDEEAYSEEWAAEPAALNLEESEWLGCDEDECCTVCLEGFVPHERVARMPCRHPFHGACIAEWLGVRRSCPVCRLDV